jgi:hypothetical protein
MGIPEKFRNRENYIKYPHAKKNTPGLRGGGGVGWEDATVSHYRAVLTLTWTVSVMTSGGGSDPPLYASPYVRPTRSISFNRKDLKCLCLSHVIQTLPSGPSISVVRPIEQTLFPECCLLVIIRGTLAGVVSCTAHSAAESAVHMTCKNHPSTRICPIRLYETK